MNIVRRHVYRLEFDTWEPFDKDIQAEMDNLRNMLKTKVLLAHASRLRLMKLEETRICQENPEETQPA